MASSGGEEIPLPRAWSRVHMDIIHLDQKTDTIVISQSDLVYKLQFALSDDKLKNSLPLRLKRKGISMKVQEDRKKSVLVELQKQLSTNEVINAVENALTGLMIKKFKFGNDQKFSQFLDTLEIIGRDFLLNGTVVVLLHSSEDGSILNMVGLEEDVLALEDMYRAEVEKKNSTASIHETEALEVSYDKTRDVYVAPPVYDIDTIQYLHLLDFKQQLSKHCKDVKCVERDDNKTEFQIEGRHKHDVVKANEYLTKFVNTVVRKSISVSSAAFEFLKRESIILHFKEKFRKCPAHIQVSNEVVVWAPTQEHLESAETFLLDSIREQIITGKVEITMEIKEIITNSKEKIHLLKITDDESAEDNKTVYQVVYLEEMSHEAQGIVDWLKSNPKPKGVEKVAYYQEHVIRYSMASRLEENIKEAFPGVEVKYSVQSKSVSITSETKNDVEHAIKEFDAYARKIKKVELKDLSEGIKQLLVRQHISEYVANTFKCRYLLFMQEEDGEFVCVSQYRGDGKKLEEKIKKTCILSTSIRKDFLQMDYGRDLLDKFADRIVQENDSSKNVSHLCYTADLQDEINSLVEKCTMRDYYRKKCNPATAEFLKIPHLSIVSKVEEKYKIKIGFEIGQIVFYGEYSLGEQASKELEKSIPNDEIILRNADRYQSLLESEDGKKTMNEISKGKNCCWSMTCQTDGKAGKLDKIMMNGINHFVSWVPSGGNSTISLVEADFTKAEFDVLVIPVDDKLCGESILRRDGKLENYGSLLNKVVAKSLPLGDFKIFENCKVFACKTLVLIPSYRVSTSNKKQSNEMLSGKNFKKVISEVFSNAFLKNQRKIGFAMPTFSKRFCAVTSSTENIEEAYLYICTQQEAESVIEDVDKVIGEVFGTKHTRRMVTSAYKGLFNKPATSVKVVKKSIFDVKAQCLVVLTSKDLNLNQGTLSKMVFEEGGAGLEKEIRDRCMKTLGNGQFITTSPGNLQSKGVKRLIFGHLPKWSNQKGRLKVLQQFVEDCLIVADEQDCKSIAFPALGTGNLKYPPRDVAAAILDGIESYIEQSMSAKLKTVFISATDDAMYQILDGEQRIRDDQNTKGVGDIANDAEILTLNDSRINFTVVMERHLQTNPSGKFVKVKFLPEMEAGSIYWPTQWLLNIGCGTTQKDLEKAVLDMVNLCEKTFITSVHVYCSKELPFSFGHQSVAIIDEVFKNITVDKYPSCVYNYLSNVTIVAGDEDGFSNIETRLSQKRFWTSIFGASREWRKESQSRPQSSIRIKLVGEHVEDVKAVKKAIEDFICRSEWQQPNVAKQQVKVQEEKEESSEEQTKIVNKTKSFGQTKAVSQTGNVGQTKAVNQTGAVSQTNINSNAGAVQQNGTVTKHEGTEKQQENMESSEVSAELNQGIVDYLVKASSEEFYLNWKAQVEDVYRIEITENREDSNLQMNVSGSFESILGFEKYLEENFPNLPKESLSAEMEYDDSHFKISDEEVTVQIPITKDEKTKLMMFYAEEINDLIGEGFLSRLLTSSGNTITLICRKDKEAFVKNRFNSLKEKVGQLQVKEIHFPSLEVMKKVETLYLNKQTGSSIRYTNDEKKMQIEIMGLDPKALDDLVNKAERVEAEVYEEYGSERKFNYFGKVSVHIYRRDILNTNVDCIVSSGGKVAVCIADAAGKTYASQVGKWYKKNNLLLSQCFTTGAGNLKRIKKVIHVNCSFSAGDCPDFQGLHHIQESTENCLLEADKQGMKSVAFPFICSAESGYGLDECAQQYIRAIIVSGQKLKSVMDVHFVDKDSVEKVCKIFDDFSMLKDNDKYLLAFGKNNKCTLGNTAIKLCSGDIQLSIAHGIAIFVDKHSQLPGNNRLLQNLQEMEKTDFQKMMNRVRENDEIFIVQSNCRMMYDVLLAACPDMKDEKSENDMYDTVTKILKKASERGFISFAIALPETNRDGRMTRPWIQKFCKALVDFLKSNKTSLKDVKIVGTCEENLEAVSKALELNKNKMGTYRGESYHVTSV